MLDNIGNWQRDNLIDALVRSKNKTESSTSGNWVISLNPISLTHWCMTSRHGWEHINMNGGNASHNQCYIQFNIMESLLKDGGRTCILYHQGTWTSELKLRSEGWQKGEWAGKWPSTFFHRKKNHHHHHYNSFFCILRTNIQGYHIITKPSWIFWPPSRSTWLWPRVNLLHRIQLPLP